jgi:hypothetical protein
MEGAGCKQNRMAEPGKDGCGQKSKSHQDKKIKFYPWLENCASIRAGTSRRKKIRGQVVWGGSYLNSFDIDIDTNEIIWSVRYDDGEAEDYNALELAAVLCENFDALT